MAINLSSKKILIAGAHANMRETIKHILVSFGAKFLVTAESGIEAITTIKKNKFDIVFCDYNLIDNKTGQQVLDEIKHFKLLRTNAIFIMITDEHRLELLHRVVDNNPDGYLIKPFSQKQLSSMLEKCQISKEYMASVDNEIDNGNLYKAIHCCEKLLQQNDKSMRLQLLKLQAELALKVGDFKTAETIYLGILQQRELPWARLGLGVVAFYLINYELAIKTFQGLIDQYPMMLEAYDWLVKTHEAMGNDELALSSLNLAVTLAPTSILRQQKLAFLADKVENTTIAQKAYMAAIKLGENSIHRSSSDYYGLANIYLKINAADKALEIAQKISFQFKNDPESKFRAALLEIGIYQEKDNERQARRALKNALELNEQFNIQLPRELRLDMAKIFCLNGNRENSINIINELVKANIEDKLFIEKIVSICNAFIGKNYAEMLIEPLNEELADFHNKAARLFKAGDIKGARAVIEQAIAKRPNNHQSILNLIKIIIHDIKTTGADPEKIMSSQAYINKAIQIGVPHSQTSALQMALDNITNALLPDY
jgi:tetratricopeptide (TPR) repeat protein